MDEQETSIECRRLEKQKLSYQQYQVFWQRAKRETRAYSHCSVRAIPESNLPLAQSTAFRPVRRDKALDDVPRGKNQSSPLTLLL